jgi:predicted ArsR family transcriptional regulator
VLDFWPMASFEDSLDAAGALADDLRRSLYLFIRAQRRPVGREEAAEAVDISRELAAFHLDKLIEKGLLRAGYGRLSGRVGPGAGRTSKLYEPTDLDVAVSIPRRSYDFAGSVLVDALARTGASGLKTVRRSAREQGESLGREIVAQQSLTNPTHKTLVSSLLDVLYDRGYEPYIDDQGAIRLSNCPFHALAQQSIEIVCGLNQALIEGVLSGLGAKELRAVLDPRPGACCIRVATTKAVA